MSTPQKNNLEEVEKMFRETTGIAVTNVSIKAMMTAFTDSPNPIETPYMFVLKATSGLSRNKIISKSERFAAQVIIATTYGDIKYREGFCAGIDLI